MAASASATRRVLAVALAVDQEDVDADLVAGGARLDPGEVDPSVRELAQHADERAGPVVGDGEGERRLIVAGRGRVAGREDDEAGAVVGDVLDALRQDDAAVELGGAPRADRCGRRRRHGGLDGGGRGERRFQTGFRQVALEVGTALRQRLRVR